MEENKNSNKIAVVAIAVFVIFALVGAFVVYKKSMKGNNEVTDNPKISYKGLIEDTSSSSYDRAFACILSETCQTLDKIDDKFVLYQEDGTKLKLLDIERKKSYWVINLEGNYESYELAITPKDNYLIGIIYTYEKESKTYSAIYSLINDKKMYVDDDRTAVEVDNDSQIVSLHVLNANILSVERFSEFDDSVSSEVYALGLNEEKEILHEKLEKSSSDAIELNNIVVEPNAEVHDYILLESVCMGSCGPTDLKIYTRDLKLISDKFDYYGIDENGNLLLALKNVVTKYDKDGNLLDTKKYGDTVYPMGIGITENILYQEGNDIKYVLNNDEVIKVLTLTNKQSLVQGSLNENVLILVVRDSTITLDEAWKTCQKNGDCEAETKAEMKGWIFGYEYSYDLNTGTIKKSDSVNVWWDE